MNDIERQVREAKFPVALTGAGISAPSGIPTFQGTWKDKPIRDFLSRYYYLMNREGFFELFGRGTRNQIVNIHWIMEINLC